MFMAGSLGASAQIHIRQLGLFGMITRLPGNLLHKIASSKLSTESNTSAFWFVKIRLLCTQYDLPSPLQLLSSPPSKSSFKSLVKAKVTDFWESKYRSEWKPSLKYFKPEFLSLKSPHPLWNLCPSNQFELNKTLVVAKLLSGRYYTDWHCRHWSQDNKMGFCVLCPGRDIPGTLEHMLVECGALQDKRDLIFTYWKNQAEDSPPLLNLLNTLMTNSTTESFVQFVLDPTVVPEVIRGCQDKIFSLSNILRLTRTYCYAIHRRRLQITGRFNWN